jgi:hypothetical protein
MTSASDDASDKTKRAKDSKDARTQDGVRHRVAAVHRRRKTATQETHKRCQQRQHIPPSGWAGLAFFWSSTASSGLDFHVGSSAER